MSLAKIDKAAIKAYVDGGFGLPTAYENVDSDHKTDETYAEVFNVPNQPETITLGKDGLDGHNGFLQINLNYPRLTGRKDALEKCDEIRRHFFHGAKFNYQDQFIFIRNCGRSQGRIVNGMYQIIITINWTARSARGA